jgi:predicted nucleic acid-binding Zn ribbon protein
MVTNDVKKCPHCGTAIKSTTFICQQCGKVTEATRVATNERDQKRVATVCGILGGALLLSLFVGLSTCSHKTDTPKSTLKPVAGPSSEIAAADAKWAFASNDRAKIISEVKRRIALGTPESTTMATTLMVEKFGAGPVYTDPTLKPLYDEANAAYEKANASTLTDAAEAAADHWRKKVDAISGKPPTSIEEVKERLGLFETAARAISDNIKDHPGASVAPWAALEKAIAAKQRAQFPMLRTAYGKALGQAVWESNVYVRTSGASNGTLIFTGGLFASNANIAEMQRSSSEIFHRLRLAKVRYEWYKDGDGTIYMMNGIPDGKVGYWEGGAFQEIK